LLLKDTIEVICEVHPDADAATLSRDTQLDELGLSSLELTEVIMEMEDRHQIEVDIGTVEAARSLRTIGDIVDALDKLIKAKG
jgi:nodulation protein F